LTAPAMADEPSSSTPTSSPSPIPTVSFVGTVFAGVESDCKLLKTSYGIDLLLLGGDPAVLRPGVRLRVGGQLLSGVLTTCMQGYPFKVVIATPI